MPMLNKVLLSMAATAMANPAVAALKTQSGSFGDLA